MYNWIHLEYDCSPVDICKVNWNQLDGNLWCTFFFLLTKTEHPKAPGYMMPCWILQHCCIGTGWTLWEGWCLACPMTSSVCFGSRIFICNLIPYFGYNGLMDKVGTGSEGYNPALLYPSSILPSIHPSITMASYLIKKTFKYTCY